MYGASKRRRANRPLGRPTGVIDEGGQRRGAWRMFIHYALAGLRKSSDGHRRASRVPNRKRQLRGGRSVTGARGARNESVTKRTDERTSRVRFPVRHLPPPLSKFGFFLARTRPLGGPRFRKTPLPCHVLSSRLVGRTPRPAYHDARYSRRQKKRRRVPYRGRTTLRKQTRNSATRLIIRKPTQGRKSFVTLRHRWLRGTKMKSPSLREFFRRFVPKGLSEGALVSRLLTRLVRLRITVELRT